MKNIRELTVLQYQQETGINKDKILYQIKKGELKAEKRKFGKQEKWIIKTVVKPTEKTLFGNSKPTEDLNDLEGLKLELAEVKGELKGKNELITELRQSKQEQAEHINTLKLTCSLLERENGRLSQFQIPNKPKQEKTIIENSNLENQEEPKSEKEFEPQEIKNLSPPKSPKTENSKIELMEFLKTQGITDPKKKQNLRARFNRRMGKDTTISKNKKGKIYLDKNQNYTKILNP